MALTDAHITLADVQTRLIGKDKVMGRTIELLKQSDPFMEDMGWGTV